MTLKEFLYLSIWILSFAKFKGAFCVIFRNFWSQNYKLTPNSLSNNPLPKKEIKMSVEKFPTGVWFWNYRGVANIHPLTSTSSLQVTKIIQNKQGDFVTYFYLRNPHSWASKVESNILCFWRERRVSWQFKPGYAYPGEVLKRGRKLLQRQHRNYSRNRGNS